MFFRFPLRPQNHVSELCDTEYTWEKIMNIFYSLQIEGHLHLLFLRNIESIELYCKKSGNDEPELLYRVCIAPSCVETVQEKRQELLRQIRTEADCSLTYRLKLDVWNKDTDSSSTFEYIVSQYCDRTGSRDLPQHLPIVGTALPLHDNDISVTSGGHLFCFLPLPLEEKSPTGLNVHLNGYFGVEQNRRHIKWPTAEQKTITDSTLKWNMHLLTDLLPKALCMLAQFAAQSVMENTLSVDQVSQV